MSIAQESKTIIITGANGHLGKVVTVHFLDRGYRVLATVHKEEDRSGISVHPNLQVFVLNLEQEKEAALFVQQATAGGKIEAALLLAGGFAMGDLAATSTEDIRKQIHLNFDTAYHIARPLLPHFLQNNRGRLVFVGSRPALQAADGQHMIAYSLSKSLLFKLADYINKEGKGKNVTATVIVPSTIDTAANREAMPDADPAKWVQPEALAGILEFVVSDQASSLRETVLKVYNNA